MDMIFDLVENRSKRKFPALVQQALDHLVKMDANLQAGKYPLAGEELVALVSDYKAKTVEESCFEAHRKYMDIHAVLAGRETVGFHPHGPMKVRKAFEESQDVELYERPQQFASALLEPGSFMIFYQHEGHMPGMQSNGYSGMIKKVVFKVLES